MLPKIAILHISVRYTMSVCYPMLATQRHLPVLWSLCCYVCCIFTARFSVIACCFRACHPAVLAILFLLAMLLVVAML